MSRVVHFRHHVFTGAMCDQRIHDGAYLGREMRAGERPCRRCLRVVARDLRGSSGGADALRYLVNQIARPS